MSKPEKVVDPRFVNFPSLYDMFHVAKVVRERAQYVGRDESGTAIYDQGKPMPVLKFRGTIKVHGTQGAVVWNPEGYHAQSKEHVLTLERDLHNLLEHVTENKSVFDALIHDIRAIVGIGPDSTKTIALFGEWAGGKIQTKASLAILPKFFNIFAIKVGGEWQNMRKFASIHNVQARIFNTEMFPTYEVEIDFSRFNLAQNHLSALTLEVEKNCPVAKYFGIPGIGEGIVWNNEEDPDPVYTFKVKGQEHSNTNVRVLDTIDHESVQKHYEFVDAVVLEPRLEQALHVMRYEKQLPFNQKSMGEFIRWIYADIVREEARIIEEKGIDVTQIGKPVSDICKKWYLTKMKEEVA